MLNFSFIKAVIFLAVLIAEKLLVLYPNAHMSSLRVSSARNRHVSLSFSILKSD